MALEFPRLVYRLDNAKGTLPVPGVGRVACKGVNDASERDAALVEGWVDSVPELTAAVEHSLVLQPVADTAPPTRDEMLAQAAKLGIEVDKRWGDKRLLAAIELQMAAAEKGAAL